MASPTFYITILFGWRIYSIFVAAVHCIEVIPIGLRMKTRRIFQYEIWFRRLSLRAYFYLPFFNFPHDNITAATLKCTWIQVYQSATYTLKYIHQNSPSFYFRFFYLHFFSIEYCSVDVMFHHPNTLCRFNFHSLNSDYVSYEIKRCTIQWC